MKKNIYFSKDENTHYLCIFNRKKEIFYTMFDTEDLEKIKTHRWFVTKKGYIKTVIEGRQTGVPEVIFDKKSNMEWVFDHINGDKLDNRKENLRYISFSANVVGRITKKRKSPVRTLTLLSHGSYRIKDLYNGTSPSFKTLGEASKAKMISLYKQGRTVDEIEMIMDVKIGTKAELERVFKKQCA